MLVNPVFGGSEKEGLMFVWKNELYPYNTVTAYSYDCYDKETCAVKSYALKGISGVQKIILPKSTKIINREAFYSLGNISLNLEETQLESIASYGVWNNLFSQNIVLPATLKTLSAESLTTNSAVTLTFKGKPDSISSTAFYYSASSKGSAFTKIYVPWSKGEVAGAPWGAKSATIYYNYTG